MLPESHRLRRHSDFSDVVRRGRRQGRRDLVLHVLVREQRRIESFGGPRFGLIVSKAVGPAVIRHRVSRRLRHICAPVTGALPADVDVVIRALPGAAAASSADLEQQVRSGLRRLRVIESTDPDGAPVKDQCGAGASGAADTTAVTGGRPG